MKQTIQSLFVISTILLINISCEKEKTLPANPGYATGVFVWCEGAFNANNGSISWYNPDSAIMVNNLFEYVNKRPAGDVIQSFALAGDYGVIVANNSQKIEVVELETFKSAGTIVGFSYPRHFVYSGNGKGYLSNGSSEGHVYMIDLHALQVTDTIAVGMGPEQLLISGDHLYVANSGGWGYGNSVSVIDTRNGNVVKTITVGDIPFALVSDARGDIWVMCRGNVVYDASWNIIEETDSRLLRISAVTGLTDREVIIGNTGDYFNPSYLAINPAGNILYYGEKEGLFSLGIDDVMQHEEPLIAKHFSSAGIHPVTGDIFALETTDYTSAGYLHLYEGGNLVLSRETGIGPGGLVFSGAAR
jgi:YVTN family beta-propeller protein